MTRKVVIKDLGLIDFKEAWDIQTQIHNALIKKKRNQIGQDEIIEAQHTLLLCEHPAVYTLGKSGTEANVLWDEQERKKKGVQYYKINRGGDITHHGPGQLVVYPIFDLDDFFTDVHRYVRSLEQVIMTTLKSYGLDTKREDGFTGVWMQDSPQRKVCAIGVHMSRWVSMHGLALNVNNDLSLFEGIVPCGIADDSKSVTSMQKELRQIVPFDELKERIVVNFADVFEFKPIRNVQI